MNLKTKIIATTLVLLGTIVLSGCDYQINTRRGPYGYDPYYNYYPYSKDQGKTAFYTILRRQTPWTTKKNEIYNVTSSYNTEMYTMDNSFSVESDKIVVIKNYYSHQKHIATIQINYDYEYKNNTKTSLYMGCYFRECKVLKTSDSNITIPSDTDRTENLLKPNTLEFDLSHIQDSQPYVTIYDTSNREKYSTYY